ncbi:MAG: indolepyruvate oxidoreductase subunit beta [Firmicutes bacterium]|uniref:Indolepyruvate oxidoreductase subunit beta n=1 Tax=Candidatus Stercoripulliclostridium pullicola TaxID=2840953 RepID=A0A940DFF6_9FIRM|nr:indolepyruvate oxidoreductase subunit beta [Candidatus Stercoripulliclostridium pullicola]
MINVLIVGVGGQGTLLASRVLGAIASIEGKDCKLSEVHGMSQRGGSVVTHVRIGDDIAAPLVTPGEADYIMAFEQLEALRWAYYLKEGGKILVNDQQIMPMPVITGAVEYPEGIYVKLAEAGKEAIVVDGLGLAEEAGNTKAVNVVMIGALCAIEGVDYDVALEAVRRSVPAKLLSVNEKALELGYKSVKK